jgi:hypothetical protein
VLDGHVAQAASDGTDEVGELALGGVDLAQAALGIGAMLDDDAVAAGGMVMWRP